MRYTLYSGAGNTFVLLEEPVSGETAALISETYGVDGVIFSGSHRLNMRIFNRDGSEAEMCGNGLRCFTQFLIDSGIHRDIYPIETLAGTYKAYKTEHTICVQTPPPTDSRWNLSIENYTLHHLNTGVPHVVIFLDSIETCDVVKIGRMISHNPLFPKRTNVNFVALDPLRVRTFERGVERETKACGTGATASVLAAAQLFNLQSPLTIQVKSGDCLKISFTPDWEMIEVEGPAMKIGEGIFSLNQPSPILSKHE